MSPSKPKKPALPASSKKKSPDRPASGKTRPASGKRGKPAKEPARKLLGDYLGAYSDQARKEFGRFYGDFRVTLPRGVDDLLRRNRAKVLGAIKKAVKPPPPLARSLDIRVLSKISLDDLQEWNYKLDDAIGLVNEVLGRDFGLKAVVAFNQHPDVRAAAYHLEHARNTKQVFWGSQTEKLLRDVFDYFGIPLALLDYVAAAAPDWGDLNHIQVTYEN